MTDEMMREALQARAQFKTLREAADYLGLADSTLRNRLDKARQKGITLDAQPAQEAPGFITENDLRLKIDIALKLETEAKAIEAGKFIAEPDFLASIGLKGKANAQILKQERFIQYRGVADNRTIYWGHPKSIARLKADHLLHNVAVV